MSDMFLGYFIFNLFYSKGRIGVCEGNLGVQLWILGSRELFDFKVYLKDFFFEIGFWFDLQIEDIIYLVVEVEVVLISGNSYLEN